MVFSRSIMMVISWWRVNAHGATSAGSSPPLGESSSSLREMISDTIPPKPLAWMSGKLQSWHDCFGSTFQQNTSKPFGQDRRISGILVGSIDRKHEVKQRKDVDQQQCSSQLSLVQCQPQIDKPWSTNYVWKYPQILTCF